jgi:Holliday junction resolvase
MASLSRYKIGRALEYDLKRHLEQDGWRVIRSAGSHSPVDLVAFRHQCLIFLQVQKNGTLPKEKRNALALWAKEAKAIGIFAYRRKGKWLFMRIYPRSDGMIEETLEALI